LKTQEPDEFLKAVAFEKSYQTAAAASMLDAIPYLHRSRVPLESVEFASGRQADFFGEECEGMCGV
jgi:hypothetical protein